MKTVLPSRRRSIMLALHLILIAIFAGIGIQAQAQAIIQTDVDDYSPGATAYITGYGFHAGESVTLVVEQVGGTPIGRDPQYHQPWSVMADGEGNVATLWNVPSDESALGATFVLTADGQLSGLHAEWTFTDGTALISSVSEAIISPANSFGVKDNTSIIGDNQGGGALSNFTIKIHSTTPAGAIVRDLATIGTLAGNASTVPQVWNGQNNAAANVPDGIYFAVAGAGGSENTANNRVKQITVDNTNPTVTLIAPADLASVLPNTPISFSATPLDAGGNDSNIEKVEFYIDGGLIGTDLSSAGGGWNFNLGAGKPAGTYTWSAKAFDKAGNNASSSSRTLTVGKLTPTFTSLTASQSIVYGTPTMVLSGIINGTPEPTGTITVTINGVTQNTTRGNGSSSNQFSVTFPTSTLGVTGSPYTITYSYPEDATYNGITNASTNLTVTPKAITVTAANATKVYGAADPAFTYTTPPGSLAPGDGLTGSLVRAAGEDVGSYAITQNLGNPIVIDPASSIPNYTVTFAPGSLSITVAPLTITAEDKSKVYDGLVYTPFTVAYNGFVNGDDETDLGGTLTFSGTATTNTSFGNNYKIIPAGLTSSNYTITFVQGNLNITRRPISIIVNSGQTKVYGDVNPTYTYSVGGDGLAITDEFTGALARAAGENVGSYAINQGTLSTRNASTLTSTLNSYTITFTGANFTITPLSVTVTADAKVKTYGAVDPALTFVSSPAVGSPLANGLLISFTGSLARVAGENVGSYAINQGTVANSNYTIAYTGANLTINPLNVTVTADAKAKTYGALDPALTFVSNPAEASALPNGLLVSFTGSLTRVAGENVGSYAINQGSVANSNYTIAYTGANLTINPLDVAVTADAKSKTYGAVDPGLTFVSNPAVGSALANGEAISFTGSLTRVAGEDVGSYAINQGSVANSNYTIAYTGALLTINPLNVTVTADATSKTYGALDPALTFVSSPAV
ncbi:MAG TPA: MBG domain-containing protein, partial [Chryseolinea sp.]|nr:MBG domain-containing protein [Chryseolinea sp.]